MIRNLRLFWLFSKNTVKASFQHRLGIFLFLAGKIGRFTVFFLFVYFLLKQTKVLAGYNLNQTLIFFLTFNFIDSFSQFLFREVYRFRPLIVSGEFDLVLIKPHHPFLRILVGGVDILDLPLTLLYIVLLTYFIFRSNFVDPTRIIFYFGLVLNALIIATAFHIIVLSLGILTTEVDHTIMIFRDMTRMASLPIDIYKEPIRSIFTFIIPVGIMMTFPVKMLFGMLSVNFFIVSLLIAFFVLSLSLYLWKTALRKYQSWGS